MEKQLQDANGKLRNMARFHNMSVSDTQRLDGALNSSRQENKELTRKLNLSLKEIQNLTSSHQDSISEKDEEISDLKIRQGEILERKDQLNQRRLDDKDDEHDKLYDHFLKLMAEKAAEIDKRDDEIATLRGIVRSDAMAPEGEGTEETKLRNALNRQWKTAKTAEAQLKEVKEENGNLRLHRAGKNNKKVTRMRQEATQERREKHAEQETEEQETEEQITAQQPPVAPRAPTAPFADRAPAAPLADRTPAAPSTRQTRAAPNVMRGLSRSKWA
jgi:hypothetical protein